MSEIKPATFKQGVPKAAKNGLFGIEEELIEQAGAAIVCVVTFEVRRVMLEELSDERYPVLEITHIEPIREAAAAKVASGLLEDALRIRTSEGTLNLGGDV